MADEFFKLKRHCIDKFYFSGKAGVNDLMSKHKNC